MKNIHVLPTDKPSRLYLGNNGNLVFGMIQTSFQKKNLNIYITSDEEIKDVRPHYGKWQLETGQILNKFPNYLTDLSECKLIIMTTDQDLIKDGVQAIDDEFLEWFVNNPSCESVEVKAFCKNGDDCTSLGAYDRQHLCDVGYKIIIPKEETLLGKTISKEDADKDSFEIPNAVDFMGDLDTSIKSDR